MIDWQAEPYYATIDRLQALAAIALVVSAEDTLALHVAEQARLGSKVSKGYRGLDRIKSAIGQGQPGILIRLPGR